MSSRFLDFSPRNYRRAMALYCFLFVCCLFTNASAQQKSLKKSTLEERIERLEASHKEQSQRLRLYEKQLQAYQNESKRTAQKSDSGSTGVNNSDSDSGLDIGAFYIASRSGLHKLKFGLTAAFYGVHSVDNENFNDTVEARYIRLTASGFVYKWLEYQIDLEFGRTAAADLRNAFINVHAIDEFQVKIGQMLLPFSIERLNPIPYLTHPERPVIIADSVLQFELGAMVHGSLFDGVLKYYAGVFNGNGHNQARDNNDGKDVAARIEIQPFKGLMIAASGIFTPSNRNFGTLSDVATVGDQVFRFLDYQNGTSLRGHRERYSFGMLINYEWLEIMADLIIELNNDYRNAAGRERDFLTVAGYLDIAVLLTGEKKSRNFVPESELYQDGELGFGAWELALRAEFYSADQNLLRLGYATGANEMISETVSLNWYPHKSVLIGLSYTRSDFNRAVRNGNSHARRYDNTAMLRLSLHF